MRMIVIGIDGVISDNSQRETSGTWDEMENDFANDGVNKDVVDFLNNHVNEATTHVMGITGISAKKRKMVMQWLFDNDIDLDSVVMRPVDDFRKEADLKLGLVQEVVKLHDVSIVAVFDSRDDVIEKFRAEGFMAFQVYSAARRKQEAEGEVDGGSEEASGEA